MKSSAKRAQAIAPPIEVDVPGPLLVSCAMVAVALPTMIAFNVPPSATFFNQAAAFIGWGAFLLVLGTLLPSNFWPRSRGAIALLAMLALMAISALVAPIATVPWTLALSAAGTIVAAALVVAVAASVHRSGHAQPAFRAFCIALAGAGVASVAIGLIQVFAPRLTDGNWIALATLAGRATGNLRQPNHLSSLLLWSVVAVIWLGETKALDDRIAVALTLAFIYVIVLSASRTGAIGMLTLAGWGVLDRRLSRRARAVLMLAPVIYALLWGAMSLWAEHNHQVFAGQARLSAGDNISSNRFAIWSNALSLIASHPWLGVGFGDFNFAWTLTPFPNRPTEFFDHTHNLVLNFAVEMGLPLAAIVLALLVYALWQALHNAIADGRSPATSYPVQRAAFVIVVLVAVHSMLEYPLWYAYFLLPTAFAFGLCLERPSEGVGAPPAVRDADGKVTRPYVLAAMFLMLGGTLAVYDYMRVVVIFAPPAGAGPLEQRIAAGRHSILFGHHADYAMATIAEHPGEVMEAFDRAPHYLLDSRLMEAWARALAERGETDKARWIADRLREFRNENEEDFFAACDGRSSSHPRTKSAGTRARHAASAPPDAASAPPDAASAPPFQCRPAERTYRFEDFR